MPDWLLIALAVLLALIVVLAVAGALAQRRRLEATRPQFEAELARADHDLAEAYATDKGWDRSLLEQAVRSAFAERQGTEPDRIDLVEVLDRPGIDEDQAVFRVESGGRPHRLTLGRRGGEWALERLD